MEKTTEQRPLGLIDTLSGGFRVLQRRPWLLLPPLLLDLWFWLGPRWSIQPLTDSLLRLWSADNLPADLMQVAEPYREVLTAAGGQVNLWWLIDNNSAWLRMVLPGLANPTHFGTPPAAMTASAPALILWAIVMLLLGVVLGSLFLVGVARGVAGDTAQSSPASFWLGRTARTIAVAILFSLFSFGLLVLGSVLLSLVLTPVFLVSPQLGSAFTSFAALLAGWLVVVVYILLYFMLAAVVSDGVGLWAAMQRSFRLVSRNFWPTLGLLVLVTLIFWGFDLIWQRLALVSPLGVVAAIIGNAILVTGLTAARLIFYQQRSRPQAFVRTDETSVVS